jgi:hypothetical protein
MKNLIKVEELGWTPSDLATISGIERANLQSRK